jgi:hypothetical protein
MTEARDLADVPNGISVNSSGLVTNSALPHFFVHKTATQTGSSGDVVSWQSVIRNNGSYWNGITHEFTAPVAGVYMFTLNWLSIAESNFEDCSIYVDGVGVAHSRTPNRSGVASSNHMTNNIAISYYLAASAVVDVRMAAFSGGTSGIYGDTNMWTTFSGYLVG